MTELLLQVGNRVSNMIWEARLDRNLKPTSQSTPDARLKFMTAKYKNRTYVQPLTADASRYGGIDENLLAAIKKMDMQNVLYTLALGANPNVKDRSRATPAVILALAAADPAAPNAVPTSTTFTQQQPRKSFPLAELLLQNGAEIPSAAGPIPLSQSAQAYLEFKAARIAGRVGGLSSSYNPGIEGTGDMLTALPVFSGPANGGLTARLASSPGEHDRLIKRSSSGSTMGRIVKGVGNI